MKEAGEIKNTAQEEASAERKAETQKPKRRLNPKSTLEDKKGFRKIIDTVRIKTGHDFRGYKTNTLVRRINRRMALAKAASYEQYTVFLNEYPEEAEFLKQDLLIGVTSFFRQPEAWEVLQQRVIAPLVETADPESDLRIWTPGCATGQEVYTLAMLMNEQLKKTDRKLNVHFFATDSDSSALASARAGVYTAQDLGSVVSAERKNRFFNFRDGRYHVIKEIREQIVFAPQSLTTDPPFSNLDLIICRNLLIYLNQAVQKKMIALFHFALRNSGFLFLGNAETIGDREDLFQPISKKWRIYRRIGIGRRVSVEIPVIKSAEASRMPVNASRLPAGKSSLNTTAPQILMERFVPVCVIIDRKYNVLYTHGMADNYLTIPSGELTTRLTDMAREGLRTHLRSAVSQCISTNRPVSVTTHVVRNEQSIPVKVTASPAQYPLETDGLIILSFEDSLPAIPAVDGDPQIGEQDVLLLEDELRITREELNSTIDQLENTNDQLKAANEEVTAANEELQSANEELETSKEELQALNEELNLINIRLLEKVDELQNTNNDVVNLLSSTHIATLFLDKQLNIRRYTPSMTTLLSLIPTDVGRSISDIRRRFNDDDLIQDASCVLKDLAPSTREVQADDETWYLRRITPYRTHDDRIEGVVITFVDVCNIKQAEAALRLANQKSEWLARFPKENPNPVLRVNFQAEVLYSNAAAAKNSDWRCEAGKLLPEPLRQLLQETMDRKSDFRQDIFLGSRYYSVSVYPFVFDGYANIYGIDITERKSAENALVDSEQRVRRKLDSILDLEGDIGTLELADILDIPAVQGMMADFHQLARIPMSIIDLKGNVLVGVGWQDICTQFHRVHPDTCRHCLESDILLSGGIQSGESKLYKCQNNMWDIATPIMIGGKHIGNIFSGQFFFEDETVDYDFFREQAHKYGFNEKQYMEALRASPRFSRKTVDTAVSFFVKMADMLSKLSYNNIKLARALTEKDTLMVSLDESRKDLDHAQQVSQTGSWRLDIRKNKLTWSDEAHRIFEIPHGTSLTYETFLQSIYPEDRDFVDLSWKRALAGEPYEIEHRILAGGKVKWVRELAELEFDPRGNMIGGFGTVQDITERKKTEAALMKSQNRYRLLVENANSAIIHWKSDGLITFFNEYAQTFFGYDEEEVIGRPLDILIPQHDSKGEDQLSDLVRNVVADPEKYITHVHENIRRDGTRVWMSWTNKPILDENGKVAEILSVGSDITAIKQMEEKLRQSHDDLELRVEERTTELEKMNEEQKIYTALLEKSNRELEDFAHVASHDLQEPLRKIRTFADRLLSVDQNELQDKTREYVRRMLQSAGRMQELVQELLRYSRVASSQEPFALIRLNKPVQDAVTDLMMLRDESQGRIELAELPFIKGDEVQIRQLFQNLIGNGLKYHGPDIPLIRVYDASPESGPNLEIHVKDNGIGFDELYLDKIFKPFQRLHAKGSAYPGTGMGLAICRRIAERHGGEITARSIPGEGSVFIVKFPKPESAHLTTTEETKVE